MRRFLYKLTSAFLLVGSVVSLTGCHSGEWKDVSAKDAVTVLRNKEFDSATITYELSDRKNNVDIEFRSMMGSEEGWFCSDSTVSYRTDPEDGWHRFNSKTYDIATTEEVKNFVNQGTGAYSYFLYDGDDTVTDVSEFYDYIADKIPVDEEGIYQVLRTEGKTDVKIDHELSGEAVMDILTKTKIKTAFAEALDINLQVTETANMQIDNQFDEYICNIYGKTDDLEFQLRIEQGTMYDMGKDEFFEQFSYMSVSNEAYDYAVYDYGFPNRAELEQREAEARARDKEEYDAYQKYKKEMAEMGRILDGDWYMEENGNWQEQFEPANPYAYREPNSEIEEFGNGNVMWWNPDIVKMYERPKPYYPAYGIDMGEDSMD